jgi:hypothetical protein
MSDETAQPPTQALDELQPTEAPACAYCGYLLAGATSTTCPECGRESPEELCDLPASLRIPWETEIDRNGLTRFVRTVRHGGLHYLTFTATLGKRLDKPIYDGRMLCTAIILIILTIPFLVLFVIGMFNPILRFGVTQIERWPVGWWINVKVMFYEMILAITVLDGFAKLILFGVFCMMLVVPARRQIGNRPSLMMIGFGIPYILAELWFLLATNVFAIVATIHKVDPPDWIWQSIFGVWLLGIAGTLWITARRLCRLRKLYSMFITTIGVSLAWWEPYCLHWLQVQVLHLLQLFEA